MNQDDNKSRHWWRDGFYDWGLTRQDQRNYTRAVMLTISLLFLHMLAGLNLTAAPESYKTIPLWLWIFALSPLLLLPFVIYAWRRFLRETEELIRRIHLESAAIGFGWGMAIYFVYSVFGDIFFQLKTENPFEITVGIMAFVYVFCLSVRIRKFSE